ncbi:hypothetical protein HGT73_11075 [Rosenbergiella australiborealis]|uniref:WavE lipopolysaccharide synthesis n=1 Tax=Rosenbergiella australiborealis TaxID=1544696 RepID=A0ABS5T6C0_9GAMM|nr:WavE lipopolysaccharide synthesis family protein [Rosenbergiella australiborealis]MBT0727906.1 hypothetical protein [Rosenbergiella australiborealis]
MHQISFVFQGKVFFDENCTRVIENIAIVRKKYPNSEIIISTWELEADERSLFLKEIKPLNAIVIFNSDPGPLVYREGSYQWVTNINRMIVSSFKGIERSTRDYIVKLRTDSFLYNDNLRKIFSRKKMIDNLFTRSREYSFFEERMINCNLFARHSRSYRSFLFHPGDIMLLGKKSDMYELYCTPLVDRSIFEVTFNYSLFSLMKYVPEQFIWVNYLKKKMNGLQFSGNKENSKKLMLLSERLYINNFIPLSCYQLGFIWPKHTTKYKNKGEDTIYQFKDWVILNNIHNGKNKNRDVTYPISFNVKVSLMKLWYFILYFPLRWPAIRRVIMDMKSRE